MSRKYRLDWNTYSTLMQYVIGSLIQYRYVYYGDKTRRVLDRSKSNSQHCCFQKFFKIVSQVLKAMKVQNFSYHLVVRPSSFLSSLQIISESVSASDSTNLKYIGLSIYLETFLFCDMSCKKAQFQNKFQNCGRKIFYAMKFEVSSQPSCRSNFELSLFLNLGTYLR